MKKPLTPPSLNAASGRGYGLRTAMSSREDIKVGTGTTTRKHTTNILWYVEQVGENAYLAWRLTPKHIPTGEPTRMTHSEIAEQFHPEVALFHETVGPAIKRLAEHLHRGDTHRSRAETYSAELEYQAALELDEDNVRATFGLGLTHLERSDVQKAESVFRQLLRLEAAFHPEHKHLFNEFGIALRKNRMFGHAVEYFSRALEICDDDENLYFNLARSHYEQGDWNGCARNLTASLRLNDDSNEALEFARHVIRLSHDIDRRGWRDDPDGTGSMAEILGALREIVGDRMNRPAQAKLTIPARKRTTAAESARRTLGDAPAARQTAEPHGTADLAPRPEPAMESAAEPIPEAFPKPALEFDAGRNLFDDPEDDLFSSEFADTFTSPSSARGLNLESSFMDISLGEPDKDEEPAPDRQD